MRRLSTLVSQPRTDPRPGTRGETRTVLLLAVVLILGFASGALLFRRQPLQGGPVAGAVAETEIALSAGTRKVLSQLQSPVDLRLFALVAQTDASGELPAFAQRINRLASAFAREAGSAVRLSRQDVWSEEFARGAAEAGLKPLKPTSETPSYIGFVVTQDGRKETIAQITPDWEAALEYDLARAIARVANPPSPPRPAIDPAQAKAALAEVNRVIPNPSAVSWEDGKKILRETALTLFQTTVSAMQAEMQQAQQQVAQAAANGSDADRQAAVERLKQLQATHAEKMSEIARQSQAQIEAWTEIRKPGN